MARYKNAKEALTDAYWLNHSGRFVAADALMKKIIEFVVRDPPQNEQEKKPQNTHPQKAGASDGQAN